MSLAEFVAAAAMLTVAAISALDSRPARAVLYAIARWRRQRRLARQAR